MTIVHFRQTTVAALAAALTFIGAAHAQIQQLDQPTEHRVDRPIQSQQATGNDAKLAACLITANENEIELGRLAQEKAESEDVKEFARKMVEEHQQLRDKLREFAGSESARRDQPGQTQRQATPGQPGAIGQPGQRTAGDRSGELDIVSMSERIARKNLESFKKVLSDKDGAEFDKCYMGLQVVCHIQMRDKLEVSQDVASSRLKEELSDAQEKVEKHLEKAQELAEQLADKS